MTLNTTLAAATRAAVSDQEYNAARDFLYLEARLADESRYLEWEALVEHDMIYWVPRGEGDFDIDKQVSITADNRSRLRTRIAQLCTGKRHAQLPVSSMRRVVSNIEVTAWPDGGWQVLSNFVLYEMRRSSTGRMEVWPGRAEHRLRRRADGTLGMFYKKVVLIHGDDALSSLAFII